MTLADVTAVATFHNDVERLPGAVRRLLLLRDRGVQVLAIDDASTDGTTTALVAALGSERSVRVVTRSENAGVAAARNSALDLVETDWVWFCDSDDEWRPDVIDILLSEAVATSADVAVAAAEIVEFRVQRRRRVDLWPHRAVLDAERAVDAMLGGALHGYLWNKLFRVRAIGAQRFPDQRSQSDFSFVFAVLSRADRVAVCTDVVYRHVLRPGSLSQSDSHVAENLRRCLDLVSGSAAADMRTSSQLGYFRAWFYLAPAARSCVRSRDAEAVDRLRSVAGQVRAADVWAARARPALLIRVVLLAWWGRAAPGFYLRVFRQISGLRERAAAHRLPPSRATPAAS